MFFKQQLADEYRLTNTVNETSFSPMIPAVLPKQILRTGWLAGNTTAGRWQHVLQSHSLQHSKAILKWVSLNTGAPKYPVDG